MEGGSHKCTRIGHEFLYLAYLLYTMLRKVLVMLLLLLLLLPMCVMRYD